VLRIVPPLRVDIFGTAGRRAVMVPGSDGNGVPPKPTWLLSFAMPGGAWPAGNRIA